MENDIPSSQMLHPTSHKEENTNYRKLWNDGTYSSTVHQYPCLGVELSEDLGWEPHINKAISKANKVLGFLRRNIGKCPQDIKEKAYLTLVRTHLEYSSAVCMGPIQKTTYQLHRNGPEKSCPIRHIYIQSRTRDGH
jgi:hypothetical protein